jgi:hypothetical protein
MGGMKKQEIHPAPPVSKLAERSAISARIFPQAAV